MNNRDFNIEPNNLDYDQAALIYIDHACSLIVFTPVCVFYIYFGWLLMNLMTYDLIKVLRVLIIYAMRYRLRAQSQLWFVTYGITEPMVNVLVGVIIRLQTIESKTSPR